MNAEGNLIHGGITKPILGAFYSVYWEVGYDSWAVYVKPVARIDRRVEWSVRFSIDLPSAVRRHLSCRSVIEQ